MLASSRCAQNLDFIIKCRKIVGGLGIGQSLVTRQPINFLTMLDAKTGVIHDLEHELYRKSIKSKVLVFPNAVGSSVGAYTLYSLKKRGRAPTAVVCTGVIDIITASACAISDIPAVVISGQISDPTSIIKTGTQLLVDANRCHIRIRRN